MNRLRTILRYFSMYFFYVMAAFVSLLEPTNFSVMLPKGIDTPVKKLTKA